MEKPERFDFTKWPDLPRVWKYSHLTSNSGKYHTDQWTITGSAELWPILGLIRKGFQRLDLPNILWFRGHEDRNYVLLPNLIRTYFSKHCSCSLPQYQKIFLEKFMAKSGAAFELGNASQLKRDNEQIECIADMQHYGIPTNLLDWSEDVGVSIYFATETEKALQGQAALYVLQPYFYNFVRNAIISMYSEDNLRSGDKFNHATARADIGGLLPNFSAQFNLTAEQYQNYITGPENFYSLRERGKWRVANPLTDKNTYAPLLPLALQVPRSNPRMRSQGGTFLAFNLCEFPLSEELRRVKNCHGLEHVELEQVQNFYLHSDDLISHIKGKEGANYDAMRSKLPFLHKIVVDRSAVPELRDAAFFLGKRKDVVYPELFHIGQQIAEEVIGI